MVALNSTLTDDLAELPGFHHIPELLAKTRRTFEDNAPLSGDPEEIGMFVNSFNSLVVFFIGSSSCQAQVLGMEPGGEDYRNWVKDTLIYLLLPRLEKLIFPDR